MSEVKWIKITTDVFDDEKILLIESLPEADSIIVIWFKLLCLAGKQNNSGVFVMGNKIPYTDKMLATIFRRKETTVQLALQTFEQFGMIELINGVITIPNWSKHQSLEKIQARKEYQKLYQREYRAKQKALTTSENDSKHLHKHLCNDDVNRIDIDKEIEEDKELDKRNIKEKITKHKYGEYKNVLLSDEDFEKLKSEFPNDYEQRIENLSSYMASTGKSYKNHLATIRNWARKEPKQAKSKASYDLDEYTKRALKDPLKYKKRSELENEVVQNWEAKKEPDTVANNEDIRARAENLKNMLGG